GVGRDHGVVIALAGVGAARKRDRCQGSGASDRQPMLHQDDPTGASRFLRAPMSINGADVAKIGPWFSLAFRNVPEK
ncbi:MAG TPA: hypothetical protein VID30_13785, partial [Bradyrhizobium sp.]